MDFYYPRNKGQFDNLLEYFKTKSTSSDENVEENDTHSDENNEVDVMYDKGYGEKSKRNRLIVMDDVSGLADTTSKFASFLTVARKFGYHCVYIFHTIHPEKSIWTILSQTNLLNIFPASVPIGTVKKILEANCIRRTTKYIPVNSLWITKLFVQLANNENEKTCLTIDCTGFNPNGPGRFKNDAAAADSQTCFLRDISGLKLLTRHLNEHHFRHNFKDTINPMCSCGFEPESTDHYLLRYKLYTDLRLDLSNDIYSINQSLKTFLDSN